MEMNEVTRLDGEVKHAEELFNNHGHSAGFFQAPSLATKQRHNVREQVKGEEETKADQVRLERE